MYRGLQNELIFFRNAATPARVFDKGVNPSCFGFLRLPVANRIRASICSGVILLFPLQVFTLVFYRSFGKDAVGTLRITLSLLFFLVLSKQPEFVTYECIFSDFIRIVFRFSSEMTEAAAHNDRVLHGSGS